VEWQMDSQTEKWWMDDTVSISLFTRWSIARQRERN